MFSLSIFDPATALPSGPSSLHESDAGQPGSSRIASGLDPSQPRGRAPSASNSGRRQRPARVPLEIAYPSIEEMFAPLAAPVDAIELAVPRAGRDVETQRSRPARPTIFARAAAAFSAVRGAAAHGASGVAGGTTRVASAIGGAAASGAHGLAGVATQAASVIGHATASGAGGVGRAGAAIGHAATSGGSAILGGVGSAISDFGAMLPRPDRALALGGEIALQLISCGIPTTARELANSGVFGRLVDNPKEALGYLSAIDVLKIPAHYSFHSRLNRDLAAAARGYFGLTKNQWDHQRTDAQRQAMVDETRYRARLVTWMEVAASIVGLVASVIAIRTGHTQLPSIMVANETRNAVYGVFRELISGSVKALDLVGADPDAPTALPPDRVESLAGVYGAMQFFSAYAQAYIVTKILSGNVTINGAVLNLDTAEQTLARIASREAWKQIAKAAVFRAGANVLVETFDSYGSKRLTARQTGGHWAMIKWTLVHDRTRVFDHSVARQAWNNIATISTPLTHFITNQQLAALTNHFIRSFNYAKTYGTVNSDYQAASSVRAEVRNGAATRWVDLRSAGTQDPDFPTDPLPTMADTGDDIQLAPIQP